MITFLVLNLDNKIDTRKLNKFLMENIYDYELVIACGQNYKSINTDRVTECVFEKGVSQDEVINSLMPNCGGDCLVLVRKIENNNFDPILNVAKNIKKENDVVVIKKKSNIFVNFFKTILSYMVKFLYGHTIYNSNLSVIGFSTVPYNVLMQTENCSTFTKINKWVGINVVEIEGDCPKVNLSKHKPIRFVRLGAYFVVLLATILLMTFLPKFFEPTPLKLTGVAIIILMTLLLFVDFTIVMVAQFVGENTYKKANVLQIYQKVEEPETNLETENKEKKSKSKTKKIKK